MKKYIVIYQSLDCSSVYTVECEEHRLKPVLEDFAKQYVEVNPSILVYELLSMEPVLNLNRSNNHAIN